MFIYFVLFYLFLDNNDNNFKSHGKFDEFQICSAVNIDELVTYFRLYSYWLTIEAASIGCSLLPSCIKYCIYPRNSIVFNMGVADPI